MCVFAEIIALSLDIFGLPDESVAYPPASLTIRIPKDVNVLEREGAREIQCTGSLV